MLRTAILLMGATNEEPDGVVGHAEQLLVSGPQVILVSSPLPGAGKSTTVANLAVAMAESGRRVLVCNGDFRAHRCTSPSGSSPDPVSPTCSPGSMAPATSPTWSTPRRWPASPLSTVAPPWTMRPNWLPPGGPND